MQKQRKTEASSIPQKLVTTIKSKIEIPDSEAPNLVGELRRFVKVVHNIATEPQAKTYYQEKKIDGKVIKTKVRETEISEFGKVLKGRKKQSLRKAFKSFRDSVDESEK